MKYLVKQKTPHGTVNLEYMEKSRGEDGKWRQHRTHLGILSPDGGELLKSRRLHVLSDDMVALLNRKGIGYTGGSAPARGRRATPGSRYTTKGTAFPRRIIEVGETRILRELCDECGLTSALTADDAFGREDGMQLLYLAIWQACTGEAQYMAENWLARHELPEDFCLRNISSGSLSALMRLVDGNAAAQQAFQEKWIAACGYPDTVIYDTTVFFTYSGRLVMAEYGYDHGHDEGLPQYNFTMAADGERLLPLAYRILPGSVTDVVTLAGTTEALRSYGLKTFLLSADKGFYSNANVAFCLSHGIDILCGVPFVSGDARRLRDECRTLLDDVRNQTVHGGCRIGAVRLEWNVTDEDGRTRRIDAWLSRNFTVASVRSESLLEKLEGIDRMLAGLAFPSEDEYETWLGARDEALKTRLKKYYVREKRCFWRIAEKKSQGLPTEKRSVKKSRRAFLRSVIGMSFASGAECEEYLKRCPTGTGDRCAAEACSGFILVRNNDAVNEEIRNLGMALHISSRRMGLRDFVEKTHERAGIETLFDMIKNDNGQERLRSGCGSVVSGRFFLSFLAAIVRQVFGNKVRNLLQAQGLKSIDDALRQLQLIRMVEYSSGKKCLVEIPKKTRELLQALKIVIQG